MSEPFHVDPQDVENAKRASSSILAMVAQHASNAVLAGFSEEQAFRLARDYHWILVGGLGAAEE